MSRTAKNGKGSASRIRDYKTFDKGHDRINWNSKKSHTEKIRCPECGTVQEATVEHTVPFYSYVHHCEKCGFIIMESEWEVVK